MTCLLEHSCIFRILVFSHENLIHVAQWNILKMCSDVINLKQISQVLRVKCQINFIEIWKTPNNY